MSFSSADIKEAITTFNIAIHHNSGCGMRKNGAIQQAGSQCKTASVWTFHGRFTHIQFIFQRCCAKTPASDMKRGRRYKPTS